MHVVYESASIMGYCICWIEGDWFVCTVILKANVDFGEVVSYAHNVNTSTFTTRFDYNELVIFEV